MKRLTYLVVWKAYVRIKEGRRFNEKDSVIIDDTNNNFSSYRIF